MLRHFTRLSQRNFAIESQVLSARLLHDEIQSQDQRSGRPFSGFAQIHPLAPPDLLQGALALLYELERDAC